MHYIPNFRKVNNGDYLTENTIIKINLMNGTVEMTED